MNRPGIWTLLRDVALFLVGVAIVLKQAGIVFPPPPGGPEIELIIIGGLFCNGPLMLQFWSLRFGSGGQGSVAPSSEPPSPRAPSSVPSPGGE